MDSPYLDALRKRVEVARRLEADMAKYSEWLDGEAKDCQLNLRISKQDLVKVKAMARARNMKYQTFLREMIQREIRLDESCGEPLEAERDGKPY